MRGHVKTCLGLNAIRGKASALSPFALRKASASAAASCREPTPTTLKTPRSELAHKRCAIDDDLVILSGLFRLSTSRACSSCSVGYEQSFVLPFSQRLRQPFGEVMLSPSPGRRRRVQDAMVHT